MLNVTPTLTSTGSTAQTIKTVWTLASQDTPVVSTGYTTFTLEIRWDPTIATVLASSVKLIGNSSSGDVVIFDTTALSSGILRAAGFAGPSSIFSGSAPIATFSFSESTLQTVNFSVTQEDINGVSYLNKSNNLYTVSLSGSGPTAPVIPVVQTFNPAQGATVSAQSASISLTFNEAVMATPNGVGTIQLRTGSATGPLVQSFSLTNTAQLNFSGSVLTITPSSPLVSSTTYYVVISPGAIQDIAGDAFAGLTNYNFTVAGSGSGTPTPTPTPSGTPTPTPTPTVGNAPQVVTFSPALGSVTSNLSTPIVVNFNEPVLPGTGNIQIFASSPTNGQLISSINVATSSSVIFSGSTLTIVPPKTLDAATTYYVVFPTGSVKDSAGNVYAGTNSYEFQTLSNVTPTPTPGGSGNPTSTLLAATAGQLMSAAALQTNLPEVPNTSLIGQFKLGNLSTLVASYNGTNTVNILANGVDPMSGVVNDSGMSLALSAPSGVGLKMQSPSGPGDIINGTTFVNNMVNKIFPGTQISSAAMLSKTSIQGGLALIGQQSNAVAVSATKIFNFTGTSTSPIQIAENLTQTDLAVLNLTAMLQAPTINVSNLSNVEVIGPGNVTNTGKNPINLIGDNTNQTLSGGSGNDFISAGGGVKTLTGGGGVNTFYFGAPVNATITDFTPSDKLMFNILGVRNFSDLCSRVTNGMDSIQGVTYTLNGNLQITIVGWHTTSNWNSVNFSFVS